MHATRHLGRLYDSAERRLVRIELAVHRLSLPADIRTDALAAFAVIELDNLWSSFVRSYYLSWAMRPVTLSGQRVTPMPTFPARFDAAIKLAGKILHGGSHRGKTGRAEPAWHEKRVLLSLSTKCAVSHAMQVRAAMSQPATAFDYLHTVRNFYAHRSQETAEKLPRVCRAFGLPPSRRGTEVVLGVPPKRTGTVLLDWIAEVRAAIEVLCS